MNLKKNKALFALISLIMASLAMMSVVSAVEVDTRTDFNYTRSTDEDAINQGDQIGLEVLYIKVNEDEVENGDEIRTQFKRDSELNIRIKMLANENISNVEIIAMINGDDHNKMSDTSEVFDVEDGTVYTKSLDLSLADIMDQDNYMLRILVADRYDAIKVYNYLLKIDTPKHVLQVKDVTFTPDGEVKQGRALLSVVRIRNLGEKDEDDVKVTVTIPSLGLSATDYIDEIEDDDTTSSEELYMRIPTCAAPGVYPVEVKVQYDELTKVVLGTYDIEIVEVEGACQTTAPVKEEKTIISVSADIQDAEAGDDVQYPIVISNAGSETKAYTVSVDGTDGWAESSITPSNVVFVEPNDMKTVYVKLSVLEDATPGEHMFSVSIVSGAESEEIALKANVEEHEHEDESFTKGLEVALIVVIIIVVILGLIIAFNKLKRSDDEEDLDDETESYY